jgi:hypothetical protein
MTHATTDVPKEGTDDTMSKLVGELLRELADDVPDKPGFESVRADLLTASKVYEYGKKKDLALRFYLAIRSLFHELERLDKTEAAKRQDARAGSDDGQGVPRQEPGTNETFPATQFEGQH